MMYDWYSQNSMESKHIASTPHNDTDSLVLEIQTSDVYADMVQMLDLNDTYKYPPSTAQSRKCCGRWKMMYAYVHLRVYGPKP